MGCVSSHSAALRGVLNKGRGVGGKSVESGDVNKPSAFKKKSSKSTSSSDVSVDGESL